MTAINSNQVTFTGSFMPGTVLKVFISDLIRTSLKLFKVKSHYYHHFSDEETEAIRLLVITSE